MHLKVITKRCGFKCKTKYKWKPFFSESDYPDVNGISSKKITTAMI